MSEHLDENGFVILDEPAHDDPAVPAHVCRQAIDECLDCDHDGYRGAHVCDHRPHSTPEGPPGRTRCAAGRAHEGRQAMIPARVGIGLMLLGTILGFLVGLGASPWHLLVLPVCAGGIIYANRVDR